jgi:hypothetical protein
MQDLNSLAQKEAIFYSTVCSNFLWMQINHGPLKGLQKPCKAFKARGLNGNFFNLKIFWFPKFSPTAFSAAPFRFMYT